MVLDHQHLVQPIARGILRKLPPSFDLADLVQAGTIGLIQAAEAWESARGIPFPVFARQRIRGAVLDSVRRRAWRESGHAELSDVAAGAPAPDELAATSQAAGRLRGALLLLPERDRLVLILHFVGGLPLRQAGARIAVSKTRAAQLIRRSLRRLRRQLHP